MMMIKVVSFVFLAFVGLAVGDEKDGSILITREAKQYEIKAEPLLIRIDRKECKDSTVSCLCYKGDNEPSINNEGCGSGYSYICLDGPQGEFLFYSSGDIVNARTMEYTKAAKITFEPFRATDQVKVPAATLRTNEICAKVHVHNIYAPMFTSSDQDDSVISGCDDFQCVCD